MRVLILIAFILSGCGHVGNDTIRSVRYTERPHCGDELTIDVTPSSVAVLSVNNCGGGESARSRSIPTAAWQSVVDAVADSEFESLPTQIVKVADGNRIEVVADDTLLCVTVTRRNAKQVCGPEHAIKTTVQGERVARVIDEVQRFSETTPN